MIKIVEEINEKEPETINKAMDAVSGSLNAKDSIPKSRRKEENILTTCTLMHQYK